MGTRKSSIGLQSLPSIGPSLAQDLRDLGFHAPDDLRGWDPEKMYADLCKLRGQRIDPCVLYSFRCAVYAATSGDKDPELRKWWNWKDREFQRQLKPIRRRNK
jgi:hypothetical protein